MDTSISLPGNTAGADPNNTESADRGGLNLNVSTDGDRNNNNNNNVDDTAASASATTSGAGDSQTLNEGVSITDCPSLLAFVNVARAPQLRSLCEKFGVSYGEDMNSAKLAIQLWAMENQATAEQSAAGRQLPPPPFPPSSVLDAEATSDPVPTPDPVVSRNFMGQIGSIASTATPEPAPDRFRRLCVRYHLGRRGAVVTAPPSWTKSSTRQSSAISFQR